jgi:integrase
LTYLFAITAARPRGFDPAVVKLIVESMPDRGRPKKGDRLRDGTAAEYEPREDQAARHLACGIPPKTLKKVTPADITLRARTVLTRQHRKGEGAKGRLLPLTSEAAEALKDFAAANLFGWFDPLAVNRSFKRAAKRFRKTWADEDDKHPANHVQYRPTCTPTIFGTRLRRGLRRTA